MKLKSMLTLAVICSSLVLFSVSSHANDQLAASLCDYVAADDKSRLRKKMKETRIKIRNVFSGISCGGNNLLRHAIVNNANGAGTFIVKKLPKSLLASNGDVEWAGSNGHSGSPIVAAIKERAGL